MISCGFSGNILVVDDEPSVVNLVFAVFSGTGHNVSSAGTVAQALSLFSKNDFDVLLTDFSLPDGNGADLAALLLLKKPSLKIFVMTGYPNIGHSRTLRADNAHREAFLHSRTPRHR